MDGYKEIGFICIVVIFALLISACTVSNPGYVGLYVDDVVVEDDTNRVDVPVYNINDEHLPFTSYLDDKPFTNSYIDSLSNELEKLVFADDSTQIDSLKSLNTDIDTVYIVSNQLNLLQNNYQRETDTIIIKSQLSKDFLIDSLSSKNTTDTQNEEQFKSQSEVMDQPDTSYITKKNPQTIVDNNDSLKMVRRELSAKNDSISQLKKLLLEQKNTINKTDTVFIVKDLPETESTVINNGNNKAIEQELLALKETIRQLRREVRSQPNTISRTDTVYVSKDISTTNQNEQNNEGSRLQENEEIKYVRNDTTNQLLDSITQQNSIASNDSVKIKNNLSESSVSENRESKNMIVNNQGLMQSDTISHLQNENGNGLISSNQTDTVYIKNKLPVSKYEAMDTILITANYNMGKIEPDNDVLSEIRNITQNKSLSKIILSGYTDISGNKRINKQITDARLNYIFSQINSLLPIENIYLQNFGDTFASQNVVKSERRVEIKLITKKDTH